MYARSLAQVLTIRPDLPHDVILLFITRSNFYRRGYWFWVEAYGLRVAPCKLNTGTGWQVAATNAIGVTDLHHVGGRSDSMTTDWALSDLLAIDKNCDAGWLSVYRKFCKVWG
jgi:hypothetical protein